MSKNPTKLSQKEAFSSDTLPIPADAQVIDMYSYKTQDLKHLLKGAGITFKDEDLKHDLQALLALANLGLVNSDITPDPDLLSKLDELNERKLDVSGNKWDHIRVFIRAKVEVNLTEFGKLEIHELSSYGSPGTYSDEHNKEVAETPDHNTMNLLITSIYAETARTNTVVLLPGYLADAKTVLRRLNRWAAFSSNADLTAALNPDQYSTSANLLSWICSKYGGDIVPASGDFKIADVPQTVHQFVVAKPTAALQNRFNSFKSRNNTSGSTLLWHGTNMMHLRSILFNGFAPSKHENAVWLAENPRDSYSYAAKGVRHTTEPIRTDYARRIYKEDPVWKHGPFKDSGREGYGGKPVNWGVLLGCEVAGDGLPFQRMRKQNGGQGNMVHTIKEPSSIMVRYIFLLPSAELQSPEYHRRIPYGPSVNEDMLAAFKKLNS